MRTTPPVYPVTGSLAAYAFWLQHEHANSDNSSLGEVRRDGWFEKRVSRLKELMNIMAVSADEVTTEVRRVHEQELARGGVRQEDNMDLEFLVRGE